MTEQWALFLVGVMGVSLAVCLVGLAWMHRHAEQLQREVRTLSALLLVDSLTMDEWLAELDGEDCDACSDDGEG